MTSSEDVATSVLARWKAHQTALYLSFSGGGIGAIAKGVKIDEASGDGALKIFLPSGGFSLTCKLPNDKLAVDETPRGCCVKVRFDNGVLSLCDFSG